jgi:two-component system, response regulator PdtaR
MSSQFVNPGASAAHATSTVLMVEDDTLLRHTTAEVLRESGYRVIEACTSSEAVEMLRSGPHVDLLFSDVQLPDRMDGVALSDYTRQHAPDTKVILTTGGPEPTAADAGTKVPMLRKPYRLKELIQQIEQLLGSHAA